MNYLPDAYPTQAASVLVRSQELATQLDGSLLTFHQAGNDFMRSSFGAAFPLFAPAMYHKLGVDWASSLLGFLSIAFIPIPFVLYKVCFLTFDWSHDC